MKHVLFVCSFLLGTAAFAQDKSFNLNAGDIGIISGFGFNHWDNGLNTEEFQFDVCVGALYSISPRIAVGAMGEYAQRNTEFDNGVSTSEGTDTQSLYSIYGRYYFPCTEKINPFIGLQAGIGSSISEINSSGQQPIESSSEIFLTALTGGINYRVNQALAIELGYGSLGYTQTTLQDAPDGQDPETNFGLDLSAKSVSVGLQWFPFSGS